MVKKIVNRVLVSIPVLIGVIFLIFLMLNVVPGNPIAVMMKEHAKTEVIERMTEYYGLNDPVLVQFGRYLVNVLHGDFGVSYKLNRSVTTLILQAFPYTLKLSIIAALVAWLIGIPAGIQGAIFSVSNVFIQSGINSFGENAIAGSSLALNFEYFTYDIANAFAQAAVTFTSQNYGAGDLRRCKKIFRYCMLFGVVFTEILSAVFMIWDDFFVSIYTTSSAVAAFAISRMRHVCSLEGLTATYEVESAALRGMGKSLEPAIFTVLGTIVFRLIWMATIFRLVPTFEMLMDVYVASWVFTGGALLIVYLRHMRKVSHA